MYLRQSQKVSEVQFFKHSVTMLIAKPPIKKILGSPRSQASKVHIYVLDFFVQCCQSEVEMNNVHEHLPFLVFLLLLLSWNVSMESNFMWIVKNISSVIWRDLFITNLIPGEDCWHCWVNWLTVNNTLTNIPLSCSCIEPPWHYHWINQRRAQSLCFYLPVWYLECLIIHLLFLTIKIMIGT